MNQVCLGHWWFLCTLSPSLVLIAHFAALLLLVADKARSARKGLHWSVQSRFVIRFFQDAFFRKLGAFMKTKAKHRAGLIAPLPKTSAHRGAKGFSLIED